MTDEEKERFWNLTSCYEGELWEQKLKEKEEQEERERLLKEQEEQEFLSKLSEEKRVKYIEALYQERQKEFRKWELKELGWFIPFGICVLLILIPETSGIGILCLGGTILAWAMFT